VIFRVLFLYALLRGLLDALTRRPDLHRRLLSVMIRRQARLAVVALRPATDAMRELGENLAKLARDMQPLLRAFQKGRVR
jgi:hypothetical protein